MASWFAKKNWRIPAFALITLAFAGLIIMGSKQLFVPAFFGALLGFLGATVFKYWIDLRRL